MKDDPFVLEWKDNHIRSWKTTDDGKKVAEEEMFTFIWNGKQYSTWLYYGRDWSKGGKPKYTKYVRIPDEKTILYITGLRNNEPRIRQVQGQRDGSKKSGEREIVLAVQSDKPILFDWQGKKYWVPAIAYKEKLDIFLIDERRVLRVKEWGKTLSRPILSLERYEPKNMDKAVVATLKGTQYHRFYPITMPITIEYLSLELDFDTDTRTITEDFAFVSDDINWSITKRSLILDHTTTKAKYEPGPQQTGKNSEMAMLINFGWKTSIQWLPQLLLSIGVRPGNVHELVTLRQCYPTVQEEEGVCCLSNEKEDEANNGFMQVPILHGAKDCHVSLPELLKMSCYGAKNSSGKVLGVKPFYLDLCLRDRVLAFNDIEA